MFARKKIANSYWFIAVVVSSDVFFRTLSSPVRCGGSIKYYFAAASRLDDAKARLHQLANMSPGASSPRPRWLISACFSFYIFAVAQVGGSLTPRCLMLSRAFALNWEKPTTANLYNFNDGNSRRTLVTFTSVALSGRHHRGALTCSMSISTPP